jgi:hypothetical protein
MRYYTLAKEEQSTTFNFRLTYQNSFCLIGIRLTKKHGKLPYLHANFGQNQKCSKSFLLDRLEWSKKPSMLLSL